MGTSDWLCTGTVGTTAWARVLSSGDLSPGLGWHPLEGRRWGTGTRGRRDLNSLFGSWILCLGTSCYSPLLHYLSFVLQFQGKPFSFLRSREIVHGVKTHNSNVREDSTLFPCRFIICIKTLSGYIGCKYKRQPGACIIILEKPGFLSIIPHQIPLLGIY